MDSVGMDATAFELKEPILRVDGMRETVTDGELAELLFECMPMRPSIVRVGDDSALAKGSIEFKTIRIAEKAYATVNRTPLDSHDCTLVLHPITRIPAPVSDTSLSLAGLPLDITAGTVFDLIREYGPVHRVKLEAIEGEATVTFYRKEDALTAQSQLNGTKLRENTIKVQELEVKVESLKPVVPVVAAIGLGLPSSTSMRAMAASFSPGHRAVSSISLASIYAEPNDISYIPIPRAIPFQSITNSSDIVDPCNLFIKALDPSIDSNDLFTLFEPFGKIVSARVMKDDDGASKQFGFVCFTSTEAALEAMNSMNGRRLNGSKAKGLIVRLHEPKSHRIREEEEDEAATVPEFPGPPIRTVSATLGLSEKARFVLAVNKIDSSRTNEVVELLQGLTKKERASCLFNVEVLKEKVAEALEVLESLEDEEISTSTSHSPSQSASPATPARAEYLPTPNITPQLSSLANLSLSPTASPSPTARPYTISEIAALPAYEILELIKSHSLESIGITPVAIELEKEIDDFIDTLTGKDSQQSKQALGEKLFKVIKSFGKRGAPRITIELLDTEPLRPLGQLMNYPEILRVKVDKLSLLWQ